MKKGLERLRNAMIARTFWLFLSIKIKELFRQGQFIRRIKYPRIKIK
jgi:hypothetical protein